ncbi:BQ5605_C002g01369 [Microbotryum silenes-dioicae]|uniref:BQ5605_C002g01369 protein n=1 Tax=Microbotryum silenes-dioicae TaxID=796604 RepID=A0A2X0P1M7_9BASI|nr:BQ5605_C002g01369 [Microbotryum silenes-dioicae]
MNATLAGFDRGRLRLPTRHPDRQTTRSTESHLSIALCAPPTVMDTYPSEFISHLHPLLFAAGLGPAVPATATSPTDPPGPSAAAAPPTNGVAGSTAPSVASPSLANGDEASTTSSDPFVRLVASLRKAFQARKGWGIWDNTRGAHHDFHAVLVDKNVRFPPIKARPVSVPPGTPIPPLHSPISPLSPSSPLFPDGIMAPIWLRKHREMIPAVFILVLRIHEYDHTQDAGPLDAAKAKDDEERHHDTDLVKEILDRKRLTSERGIKLAVVLLCSRRLLDDPALDQRLSLIRRQSGLDSRASLFVISPVPQAEVTNFVQSLREELFPAALDYYREHGRRVRRKRARQMPKGGLSDKGWNVRYDYKMAFFSEMRGETEVALKHYEDCYNTLIGMFANSTLLPPRTKRWAEAKVLADCTSVKVAKMHMYLSEPSLAVAQLNRHVATFRELSNTWGIGDKTFEFWSWQSKQYRLFGDLVAIGIRNGFSLPILRPVASSRVLPPGAPPPPTSVMMPSNALQHPGHYFFLAAGCAIERWERFKAVKAAYEAARDAGAVAPIPEGGKRPPPLAMGPALTHESKVDHADIIIEVRTILASFIEICSLTNVTSRSCVQLYTKAYEFFKAHRTKNMTFYVASQIALTHYEAGNHEMALKFNDRIAKNYRKDRWSGVLDSILQLSLESAQRIGDWESAIRCCLELMAPSQFLGGQPRIDIICVLSFCIFPTASHITVDERDRYSALALEMMQTRAPASPGKSALIFRPTDSAPLCKSNSHRCCLDLADHPPTFSVYCRLAFWRASVDIRDAAPFQLVLEAPTSSRSSAFIFSELVINFTGGVGPIIVSHSGVETPSKSSTEVIRLLDKGDARLEADLCWRDGSTKTFEGVVTANESCELTVSDVILKTKIGEWDLSFALQPEVPPTTSAEWFLNSTQRVSLSHLQSGVCSVSARKLRLDFSIEHPSPAYVGEVYPVHIEFVNEDEFDIDVYLDILLQPGEDESPNRILVDEEWSLSFIKGISLGTITPKTRLRKTMHLECVGAAGDRLLDLSVRSIASSLKTAPVAEVPSAPDNGIIEPAPPSNNFTELLRSIIIPAVDPLRSAFQVMVHQKRKALKPLLDLAPPSEWDAASDVTVVGTIHAAGPWDLEMTSLKLVSERTGGVRVVHSSLTHLDKNVLLDWNASDLFNCLFQLEVASSHAPHASSAPFIEAYWRRRRSAAAVSRTLLPLPPLEPVMLEPAVTLSLPATLRIHELTKMRYKFSNPTNRVTTLSFTVEGAEPGTFTFAGPRKYPSFVLAPDEERTLDMVVVPLVVGLCALPRMRVFHHERVPLAPEDQSNEREAHLDPSAPEESARRARELKVVAETAVHEMKDPAQVLMEEDLRAARGGDRLDDAIGNPPHPPFVVMVLPR